MHSYILAYLSTDLLTYIPNNLTYFKIMAIVVKRVVLRRYQGDLEYADKLTFFCMSLNERSEESTKDLAEANKAQNSYWKENTAKKMSDDNEIMYDAETLGKVIKQKQIFHHKISKMIEPLSKSLEFIV